MQLWIFVDLFIYNNFICNNNQYKKAAIREELNPHVQYCAKVMQTIIVEYRNISAIFYEILP